MLIPQETVERIKAASRLEDVIPGLQSAGKSRFARCPKCGHYDERKRKGLMLNPARQIAKCFSCGFGTNNPVNYLMEVRGLSYPEALEELARIHGIETQSQEQRLARLEYERRYNDRQQALFLDRQLQESGLTQEDTVTLVTLDDGSTSHVCPFRSGTRSQYGNIQPGQGDDMLIYFFDLQGRQVTYRPEKSNCMKPLVRVRWQNPDLHRDREGKPKKYESPYGSGSHVYIPGKIRKAFQSQETLEILFLQEGEKKAEKACKHGIPSLGLMGIQNIGDGHQTLSPEIQQVIRQCGVREVVFLLDSDWDQVSQSLASGEQADLRPRSFFHAVRNYKEYMRTLINMGIFVEIWFGTIRPSDSGAKGIDDLLVRELAGREQELRADIDRAMHHKQGQGEWVQMHKITMMADSQIADLWLLNDAEAFARRHKEKLIQLPEFRIGRLKRRFGENGRLELAQPLLPSEQYWLERVRNHPGGEDRTELSFDYANCFNFLRSRGFGRVQLKSNTWEFIHIENRVVYKVDNYEIKDYVTDFTKELGRKDILNMLYRGGPQYLGYEKLSNLDFIQLSIEKATQDSQCLFFQDKIWRVSSRGIEELSYSQFSNHVWADKVNRRKVTLLEPLIRVERIDEQLRKSIKEEKYKELPEGEFLYDFSPEGEQCHFLQFLANTSNFAWRKQKRLLELEGEPKEEEQITLREHMENRRHLVNKLTAIGYLLHDYKNDSELKAVIGMDGRLSEVGYSNGRTGKSLVGKALEFLIPQVYIPAKSLKITEDQFLFGEVTEKTRNIFLDDVRANVDFEFFFPLITGKLKVNPKGMQPFTLEQEDTPKLYMTTNHAINGEGASFKDRQAFMAFSDFYNEQHKPVDDFGINFFSEWDARQWNLFYNLMATCLVLYFRSMQEGWAGRNAGIVEPPMETIEKRHLRQMIGEDFLQWAEAAFSVTPEGKPTSESKLNQQCIRKELFDNFTELYPHARKYVTSTSFGKRMRCYCRYKGLHFNPTKHNEEGVEFMTFLRDHPYRTFEGREDKSNGREYWTIVTPDWVWE